MMGGAAPGEPKDDGGLAKAKPRPPSKAKIWKSKNRSLDKPPRKPGRAWVCSTALLLVCIGIVLFHSAVRVEHLEIEVPRSIIARSRDRAPQSAQG